MHLEVFAEGRSIFHSFDPRVKIIVFLFFVSLCIAAKGLLVPFLYLITGIVFLILAKLEFKKVLNRLIPANGFLLFFWVFVPFMYKSNPYIIETAYFKVSLEGVHQALIITLKCNAILMATIALLGTSNVFALAHAMLHFKVPAKLVTVFFVFYRYITVLHEEYLKIKRAALARGFVPKNDLKTYKTYGYLVASLLVKSFERSEEVYRAMLARGFKGFFPVLNHFFLKTSDLVFAFFSIAVIFLIYFFNL
ncbi:cobalt ECF transporter T component CbiQ [Thermodesulfobacterium sp. TA1]|uniref:cobalt ECF transporter T component CbiQ n=1 Tax=Thermodesulfobacterium sp. TA1 TaxID=2234087 RepID=UPI0012324D84|nr:cobalt ECF transporter T component CbiQ [Thermodesulfobacterium sp. TA1]QER42107.1 cobalt ECF transporter T component CbiQ [Thermodesulfobacterium sp. TA1]